MRHLTASVLLLVLTCGCGNKQLAEMSKAPPAPWEALTTFMGEPLMSVGYPMEMGNWGAVKSALSAQKFADALAAFEQSPLPSGHTDKQGKKDAMLQAWRDAIDAAKSAPQEELKTKVQAAITATTSLQSA